MLFLKLILSLGCSGFAEALFGDRGAPPATSPDPHAPDLVASHNHNHVARSDASAVAAAVPDDDSQESGEYRETYELAT